MVQLAVAYGEAKVGAKPLDALKALVAAGKFPAEFEPEDEVARWGQLYSYVFSEHVKHPNEQRELISALVGTGSTRSTGRTHALALLWRSASSTPS